LSMVSIETRRTAAELLVDFYKGRLTNDQFDDSFPYDKSDPAVSNIRHGAWLLYDDMHEHYLEQPERQSYKVAKYVHRMLTFLKSELEYEWVGFTFWRVEPILELFNRQRRSINRSGDVSVWPFYRKADYLKARVNMRKSSA